MVRRQRLTKRRLKSTQHLPSASPVNAPPLVVALRFARWCRLCRPVRCALDAFTQHTATQQAASCFQELDTEERQSLPPKSMHQG